MSPAFAVAIPRPFCWLAARGVIRDWTLGADPGPLVGALLAIFSPEAGASEGYRRLAHLLRGTAFEGATVAQVRAECPKGALVGVARLELAGPVEGRGWRLHLVDARPVGPVPCPGVAGVELLGLPLAVREALARAARPSYTTPPRPEDRRL